MNQQKKKIPKYDIVLLGFVKHYVPILIFTLFLAHHLLF